MKKRIILLAIMVIALALALSISVYAAYEKDRTSVEYKGQSIPVVKFQVEVATVNSAISADTSRGHSCSLAGLTAMADDDAYVILKDTNGGLTAYPSWYIIDATYTEIYEISYGYLNSVSDITGKTYTEGSILYMEFPNGLTQVRNNGVFGKKGNGSVPYETNVTDFYIPSTATAIQSNAFNSMPKLENVFIAKGNTISIINSGAFSNSSVKYVQFENLTEITSIDGFTNCGITGDIDLSACTKLKEIKNGCFQASQNIGKITLPNSVETIGNSAFENTGRAYLASSYLPSSLKSVGQRFFAYNQNLLNTYIFPVGVTSLPNEPFQDSRVGGEISELNIVFLGKVQGIVYLNGNGHQKHAKEVTVYFAQNSRSEYNTNGFYIKPSGSSVVNVPDAIRAVFCAGNGEGTNGNVTGVEYIYITSTSGSSYTSDYVNNEDYGFDFDNHTHYGSADIIPATCGENGFKGTNCIICDDRIGEVLTATGIHTVENDYDCTTADACLVCHQEITKATEGHQIKTEANYENGFDSVGARVVSCSNEGCLHGTRTEMEAMFNCLGYSVQNFGTGGISLGFKVNNEAIAEYKEITGADVKYGVFAASFEKLGSGEIFENGVANRNAICAEINTTEFAVFDLKITGFTDAQKDASLALGAYVSVTKDGATEYSYMQDITKGEKTGNYFFASFNDIIR